jgi:hypothetical protein
VLSWISDVPAYKYFSLTFLTLHMLLVLVFKCYANLIYFFQMLASNI